MKFRPLTKDSPLISVSSTRPAKVGIVSTYRSTQGDSRFRGNDRRDGNGKLHGNNSFILSVPQNPSGAVHPHHLLFPQTLVISANTGIVSTHRSDSSDSGDFPFRGNNERGGNNELHGNDSFVPSFPRLTL